LGPIGRRGRWRCHRLLASAHRLCRHFGDWSRTLRIVTNPFGEYLDCTSADTALAGLKEIKAILAADTGVRIRFALGAARTKSELSLVPQLIAAYGDLANICVNVRVDEHGFVDAYMVDACAGVVGELAACTPRGEGNFNFTVNFHCPPLIPYFPAGCNLSPPPPPPAGGVTSGAEAEPFVGGECFAIGLEHPDLLVKVLDPLRLGEVAPAEWAKAWARAAGLLKAAIEVHTTALAGVANECARRACASPASTPPPPRQRYKQLFL